MYLINERLPPYTCRALSRIKKDRANTGGDIEGFGSFINRTHGLHYVSKEAQSTGEVEFFD